MAALKAVTLQVAAGPSSAAPAAASSTFPCIMPFPEAWDAPACKSRRGTRERQWFRGKRWAWVNCLFGLFAYWELGCPRQAQEVDRSLARLARPLNDLQLELASNLLEDVLPVCRLTASPEVSCGTKSTLHALERLREASYHPGFVDPAALSTTARPVDPSRISLPETAGQCDPALHLRGEQLVVFNEFLERIAPPCPPVGPLPRACHLVDKQSEFAANERLLDSKMACLIHESNIPRDTKGNATVAGLFAVEHKVSHDRLIVDRRPQNATEKGLRWARLPWYLFLSSRC